MFLRVRSKAIPLLVLIPLVCLPAATLAQVSQSTPPTNQSNQTNVLTIDEALRLANSQVSIVQAAVINERIAAEDLRQARAAFLPKISAPLSYIYTSPALELRPGEPRVQSFIANNAINEYEALANVSGDLDIAGRLRATVAKSRALLAAARAGTDVAKRALAQAVIEAYYALALATAQRRGAETNLKAADEFEHITSLLLSGGEVAAVDLTRAQLQTIARRDELEKALVNEEVADGGLRILIGYQFNSPFSTSELITTAPQNAEYQQFKAEDVSRRPEFIQFEQQFRAAREDVRIARADRLPSLSYSINGGFDSDSLKAPRLKEHTGASAQISLNIPIFDWGVSKSREQQARLRADLAENERTLAQRQFTQQFYAARAQAASAIARMSNASAGVTKAQDNLAASIARYRAGEAPIVEVTDAQTTLVEQRAALYQASYDYQVALARLRQATGQ